MAQLCLPLSQDEQSESATAACPPPGHTVRTGGFGRFDTPDASDNSGGSSTHPFYDPDSGESWGPGGPRPGTVQKHSHSTPDDRVTFIRQLLCRCVFDFVLKEANAQSHASAMTLENARQTCIQYLVRPPLAATLIWILHLGAYGALCDHLSRFISAFIQSGPAGLMPCGHMSRCASVGPDLIQSRVVPQNTFRRRYAH